MSSPQIDALNTRRTRRQSVVSLVRLVAACWVAAIGTQFARSADPPPNIVIMLSDDHSVPYLGCYGTAMRTPNFDRFAAEGIRCDRYFVGAPQCVPARASLMTGRSPVAVRMTRFTSPLPPDVVTFPELLRGAGYYTGICRRTFHLDGPVGSRLALASATVDRFQLRTFAKRVDYLDVSPPGQTTARVNEFLDKVPSGKPFFLWVNFNDPHHAWDSDAVSPNHDPAQLKLPAHLPDLPGVRSDLGHYIDEIARVDGEFQSVLDILSQRGLDQNTLVMFAGDNGMAFPHGKGSLYDPGINVPLLVRWPGRIKAGSVTRELLSSEDIGPTLLAAAGVKAPPEMSGRNFLPLLEGKPQEPRKYIFAERGVHGSAVYNEATKANTFDLSRCVRSQRYKLIYNCTPHQHYAPVDSEGDPSWKDIVAAHEQRKLDPALERTYFTHLRPIFELYDLDADPSELKNLAGDPQLAAVERELKIALQDKMIVDYDYLPLPIAK